MFNFNFYIMLKNVLSTILVASLMLVSCKEKKKSVPATKIVPAVQTVMFGVRGNCKMCKKTIETAALGVAGVTSAIWNKETKQIEVKHTGNINDVHGAIANAGYDTDNVTASDATYNELPECCQYDRNQKFGEKKEGDDHHAEGEHHE